MGIQSAGVGGIHATSPDETGQFAHAVPNGCHRLDAEFVESAQHRQGPVELVGRLGQIWLASEQQGDLAVSAVGGKDARSGAQLAVGQLGQHADRLVRQPGELLLPGRDYPDFDVASAGRLDGELAGKVAEFGVGQPGRDVGDPGEHSGQRDHIGSMHEEGVGPIEPGNRDLMIARRANLGPRGARPLAEHHVHAHPVAVAGADAGVP